MNLAFTALFVTLTMGGQGLAADAAPSGDASSPARFSDDGARCLIADGGSAIRYRIRHARDWPPTYFAYGECDRFMASPGAPVDELKRCDTNQYACIETGWALPVAVPKTMSSPLAVVGREVMIEPQGVGITFIGATHRGCRQFRARDTRHEYWVRAQIYTVCPGIGVSAIDAHGEDGRSTGIAILVTKRGLLSGW